MNMFSRAFERLRTANKKQLETIRLHNGLASDSGSGFVRWQLIVFLLVTLLLCIADAVLSIHLLKMGAWEANPFMRFAMSVSLEFFILSKYILTAGGLLLLLRFGKVRILDESVALEEIAAGFILFYLGLVLYEIECSMCLG